MLALLLIALVAHNERGLTSRMDRPGFLLS
jgi:hypothetical protein